MIAEELHTYIKLNILSLEIFESGDRDSAINTNLSNILSEYYIDRPIVVIQNKNLPNHVLVSVHHIQNYLRYFRRNEIYNLFKDRIVSIMYMSKMYYAIYTGRHPTTSCCHDNKNRKIFFHVHRFVDRYGFPKKLADREVEITAAKKILVSYTADELLDVYEMILNMIMQTPLDVLPFKNHSVTDIHVNLLNNHIQFYGVQNYDY